jgi:signal transduction histidine kinase
VAVFFYRERTRRQIAAIEKQLLADAIEQKNSMLAEVAHELRSPLTALKLQVESLQYNLEDDPEAAYQRLNNKVTELNKLIEDLYDLARADNGLLKLNKESVSVQDLVEDITDGYQEVVEHKGLQLKTEIQLKESDYFTVDALRIKQVIVNLIRNSINYTNSPGTISCTAKSSDKHCEIILEDSAPGVPGEEIPRLFERMYRADGTRDKDASGSGLGLSICKSLVEAHNGNIKASSSQLGGLCVKISLPKDQDEDSDNVAKAA